MLEFGYSVEGVIGSVIRYQHTKHERIEDVSLCWVSFDIMPPPVDYFDCGCVAREIMSWVKSRWWDMGSLHVWEHRWVDGGLRSLPPDVRLLARGAYSARNFRRACSLGDSN